MTPIQARAIIQAADQLVKLGDILKDLSREARAENLISPPDQAKLEKKLSATQADLAPEPTPEAKSPQE